MPMSRCQLTEQLGSQTLIFKIQKGMKLTSSLANLGDCLLDGHPRRPSNSLPALKFILLLVEAVQSSTGDVEEALGSTDKGTEGHHDGHALD